MFLHAAHGRIMPGLPIVDPGVPLLLVGNHQLLLDSTDQRQDSDSLSRTPMTCKVTNSYYKLLAFVAMLNFQLKHVGLISEFDQGSA